MQSTIPTQTTPPAALLRRCWQMCLPAENSWVTCIYVHTTHTTQFTSIYWYVYIINYVYIYIYTEISLRRESERILLLTVENIQSILLIAKVYLDSHTNPSRPTDAHNHKRRMREHQRRLRQRRPLVLDKTPPILAQAGTAGLYRHFPLLSDRLQKIQPKANRALAWI